jgi:membrane protease YdiL (CAAX protease family)
MLVAQETGSDAVAFVGVLASFALAWGALKLRGIGWAAVGMRRPPSLPRTVAVAGLAVLVLLPLTSLLSWLVAMLTGWSADISRFEELRENLAALMAGLLLVWTLAAFAEELLFRGLLLHFLHELFRHTSSDSRTAWAAALVLTSAAFGLAHAYQGAAGVILTAIIGLGLGLTYFAAGRTLWAPILTHGLYDTVGFVVVYLSWDQLLLPGSSLIGI